jgi:3',5'-cyclic AMP phosphodiesterase CpdA
MKFIHLTDTHLVEQDVQLYGLNPQARLRAAVDSINATHADAAFAVITGDLAHRGEPGAYELLKEELSNLCMPLHVLIGNHDDRPVFCKIFSSVPVDPHGFVQFAFTHDRWRFVGLDTHEPGVSWGVFCERRAEWLSAELSSHDLPVYLFMHHPPFPVGMTSMDRISMREPALLRAALEPHRQRIRHLFFGHLHRPVAGSWLGIPVSTQRATSHQVALDLRAGPAVPGSHEPPQYGVVLAGDEETIVHMHDFMDGSARFDL